MGVIGGRWYSCRSTLHPQEFDVVFSLWTVCTKLSNGSNVCQPLEEREKFKDVILDFQVIRILAVSANGLCGFVFAVALINFTLKKKKVLKNTVLVQAVATLLTVMLGLSGLVYAAVRAQDIVGENVKYVYGWSCVVTWIGIIIAFLNAILTLVLICVHLDTLWERALRVSRDLNMDNVSLSSTQLERMARASINSTNNDNVAFHLGDTDNNTSIEQETDNNTANHIIQGSVKIDSYIRADTGLENLALTEKLNESKTNTEKTSTERTMSLT